MGVKPEVLRSLEAKFNEKIISALHLHFFIILVLLKILIHCVDQIIYNKTDLKELTDLALLSLLKEDNNDAFNEIYARYWDVVYAVACKKLLDKEEAKDVVHDMFLLIWLKRNSIQITTTFAGYIYVILKNKLTDLSRRRILQLKHSNETIKSESGTEENVFERYASKDMVSQLQLEIENMPVGMRKVFLMSREEQLSVNEIANKLSISSQTVKNQITSALKRLREKYPNN
ncbi:RNA polymerase sigma factor [Pedobacter frigoris]|uniref:RNA polymerase sigma factor n=1 Tax=Pedobacter frigoris TaxID=2571272 RepID=UPI00292CB8E4|nr:sigma-70 family RNA polymerase sigma factor [Pedobacter frigoris]